MAQAAVERSSLAVVAVAAASTGLCGSLSTVSTYVNEVAGLDQSSWRPMIYAAGSIGMTQALLLAINGIFLGNSI